MSHSLNRAIFIGHIGADPESRVTKEGVDIAILSIATTSSTRSGAEWVEATDWHRLTAFDRNATFLLKYAKKGALLAVDCTVKPSNWTDTKGVKHYVINFVVQRIHHLGKPTPKSVASFRPEGHVPAPPDYGEDDERNPPPHTEDDYLPAEPDGE